MKRHLRSYIRKHFVVALIAFVVLALLTHLHDVWWRQLQFLVFGPVYYVTYNILPEKATWAHGGMVHIFGEISINLIGFLWIWLIVYVVAKAWAYLKKGRHNTKAV
jgi:hypothetical protein